MLKLIQERLKQNKSEVKIKKLNLYINPQTKSLDLTFET